MAVEQIFNFIRESGADSQKLLLGMQNTLIQTKENQLREQQMIFNNSLQLRQQDFREGQQVFENALTQAKFGMAVQGQKFQDQLDVERLKSQQALTEYRRAQTARVEAKDFAAGYVEYPVNGTPEEWMQYGNTIDAAATGLQQQWGVPEAATGDPVLDQVLGSEAEEDTGGNAGFMLFEEDPAALNAGRLPPMNLDAITGPAIAAATAPKPSGFDTIQRNINETIARVQNSPNPQGVKLQQIQGLAGNLMRIASSPDFQGDPKAQAFLNDTSPERSAVQSAAARGDEATARALINENTRRNGFPNPVLADAYEKGSQMWEQSRVKQQQLDELKTLQSMKDEAGAIEPWAKARIDQLVKEIYGQGSTQSGDTTTTLRNLRPAAR